MHAGERACVCVCVCVCACMDLLLSGGAISTTRRMPVQRAVERDEIPYP